MNPESKCVRWRIRDRLIRSTQHPVPTHYGVLLEETDTTLKVEYTHSVPAMNRQRTGQEMVLQKANVIWKVI